MLEAVPPLLELEPLGSESGETAEDNQEKTQVAEFESALDQVEEVTTLTQLAELEPYDVRRVAALNPSL